MWYYFFTWWPLGSVNDLSHTSRILFLLLPQLQILDSSWLLDSSGMSAMSMVVGFFNLKGKKCTPEVALIIGTQNITSIFWRVNVTNFARFQEEKLVWNTCSYGLGFLHPFFFSSGVKSLILQDFPMEKFGKEHGNLTVVTVMMEYFYIMNLATMESYKKNP